MGKEPAALHTHNIIWKFLLLRVLRDARELYRSLLVIRMDCFEKHPYLIILLLLVSGLG